VKNEGRERKSLLIHDFWGDGDVDGDERLGMHTHSTAYTLIG
jgi:hypothetical protein